MRPSATTRSLSSAGDAARRDASAEPTWTFLTNHAHVLILLSRGGDRTLREVAEVVGITERAAQRIVAELEDAGYVTRHKDGRRNSYEIHDKRPLRHSIEAHKSVGDLIRAVTGK
jgi:DNA-binding MarR family transcriptional regulator